MSTLVGHSALHALHSRQRQSTSFTAGSVSPAQHSWPLSARRNALALPRLLCFSSRLSSYDGPITARRVLRRAPTRAHRAAASDRAPARERANVVPADGLTYPVP